MAHRKISLSTGIVAVLALTLTAGCGGSAAKSILSSGGGSSPIGSQSTPATNSGISARFHVDVKSGKVSVVNANGPKASSNSRTIFSGTALAFNSSTLFNLPGSTGTRQLSVSMTNNSGLTIGQDPTGTVGGLNVVFSAFSNVGAFPDVRSQTNVSTITYGFNQPYGVVSAGRGTFYVADTFNNQIKMISNGNLSVLAGKGTGAELDGQGINAAFHDPVGIAINPVDHALIVADSVGNNIRRVTVSGQVTTIAGKGVAGLINSTGNASEFNSPYGVAVDNSGNIYVADSNNDVIRMISLAPGADPTKSTNYNVTTLAGGTPGFLDGAGAAAEMNGCRGIVYSNGLLYFTDKRNNAVRTLTTGGVVTTIAGTGALGTSDALGNLATFNQPTGITVVNGSVIVAEGATTSGSINLRQITPVQNSSPNTPTGWQTSTIAGSGTEGYQDGSGASAQFNNLQFLSSDTSGNIYVADSGNNVIREITPSNGIFPIGVPTGGSPNTELVQITNPTGYQDSATAGQNFPYINYPGTLADSATSPAQNWWFSIPANVPAFEFSVTVQAAAGGLINTGGAAGQGDPTEFVSTVAGNPTIQDPYTLPGTGSAARFNYLTGGIATFSGAAFQSSPLAGYTFVTDWTTVDAISPTGAMTPIAGGYSRTAGADGPGNTAGFGSGDLTSIAVGQIQTSTGVMTPCLFVGDLGTVRLLLFNGYTASQVTNQASWNVITLAGSFSSQALTNGNGSTARFDSVYGIVQTAPGLLYICDYQGSQVRQMLFTGGDPTQPTNWLVWTFAGSFNGTSGAQDGTSTNATFNHPQAIASDTFGNLYVADTGNFEIRKISRDAKVVTVAGSSTESFYADGYTPALLGPFGIATDSANYVYITDGGRLVRKLSPGGLMNTVAGSVTTGDLDGPGNAATFNGVHGITVTAGGDILLTETNATREIQKQITAGSNARTAKKK